MPYDRGGGPIRPFHEGERAYIFRYFCGDDQIPSEQAIPKSQPQYICACGTTLFVEKDSKGPWLRFREARQRHFAATYRTQRSFLVLPLGRAAGTDLFLSVREK
jgi:hypothetical protein